MLGNELRLGRVISTMVESSFKEIVDSTTSSFTTYNNQIKQLVRRTLINREKNPVYSYAIVSYKTNLN